MVHDEGRHVVRILALYADRRDANDRLRLLDRARQLQAEVRLDVGDRDEVGLLGQAAEGRVEKRRQFLRRDGPDHANDEVVAGECAAMNPDQIVSRDRGNGLRGPVRGSTIRMVRERRLGEEAARDIVGIGGARLEPGQYLRAYAFRRFGVEAGLRQGQPQEFERLVAAICERLQAALDFIAAGVEGELHGRRFEARLEGVGVEGTGALVEKARHEAGEAGHIGRILRGAAAEGEIDGDQRHGVVGYEPRGDAAGAGYLLHFRCSGADRDCEESGDNEQSGGAEPANGNGERGGHERFSSPALRR